MVAFLDRQAFFFGRLRYIAAMLWRMRSRGRPLNAPAAFIHPCQPIVAKHRNRRVAHSSVPAVQRYFSRSSSNSQCLFRKLMSPVISTIDRTAAYSDRQPY